MTQLSLGDSFPTGQKLGRQLAATRVHIPMLPPELASQHNKRKRESIHTQNPETSTRARKFRMLCSMRRVHIMALFV